MPDLRHYFIFFWALKKPAVGRKPYFKAVNTLF